VVSVILDVMVRTVMLMKVIMMMLKM